MKASLFIIAGLLSFSLAVVACGDTEEEPVPDVTVTASGSAAPIATPSPTPSAAASTPAPAPSGWKVYVDPVLGFSLSYPGDLVFNDLTGSSIGRRHLQFRSQTDRLRSFTVGIIENSEGLTLDEWVHQYSACIPETIQQRTVSGRAAVSCVGNAGEVPEPAVVFEFRGNMLLITTLMPPSEFDSIIGSIRL